MTGVITQKNINSHSITKKPSHICLTKGPFPSGKGAFPDGNKIISNQYLILTRYTSFASPSFFTGMLNSAVWASPFL
jgi:hypothetical protein